MTDLNSPSGSRRRRSCRPSRWRSCWCWAPSRCPSRGCRAGRAWPRSCTCVEHCKITIILILRKDQYKRKWSTDEILKDRDDRTDLVNALVPVAGGRIEDLDLLVVLGEGDLRGVGVPRVGRDGVDAEGEGSLGVRHGEGFVDRGLVSLHDLRGDELLII